MAGLAATTLAACGPPSALPAIDSYAIEARFAPPGAPAQIVRVTRAGALSRVERAGPEGGTSAIVRDAVSGRGFAVSIQDGRAFALTFEGAAPAALAGEPFALEAPAGKPIGACAHLGETGRLFEAPGPDGPRRICASRDGVPLAIGGPDGLEWEALRLDRSAPDPALFQIPPGAEVMSAQAFAAALSE